MVFKFMIISDEVDNFLREIEINADATFLDLQNIILESVGYTKDQMTSFFICDEEWNKQTEITLIEMDTSSDVDNYVMQDTHLEDLLEDEKQKLIFVFEYMTERCFFMELRSIIPGDNLKTAKCIRALGNPPEQIAKLEDIDLKQENLDLDEDFYGDSEYDINEIDKEGFDGFYNENISNENSY